MTRKLRESELEHATKDIAHAVAQIARASEQMFASCLSCRYFDEANAYCTGHQAKPPPRIIVNACDQYSDVNEAPFP